MQQVLDAITSNWGRGGLWAVALALGINAFGVFYEAGAAKTALKDHTETIHPGVRVVIERLEEVQRGRYEKMMETLQEIRDVVVSSHGPLRGQ